MMKVENAEVFRCWVPGPDIANFVRTRALQLTKKDIGNDKILSVQEAEEQKFSGCTVYITVLRSDGEAERTTEESMANPEA